MLGVFIRCAGRVLERPFGAVNDVGGDSFAVGLGAVAGACVGRGSGQPRMPPRERQHEGLGGGGGFFHTLWSAHSAPSRRWSDATRINALFVFWFCGGCCCVEDCCGLTTGVQTRMPPQERRHEGLIGGFLRGAGAGAGAVRSGMTLGGILLRLDWEPLRGHVLAAGAATHAAAGAQHEGLMGALSGAVSAPLERRDPALRRGGED